MMTFAIYGELADERGDTRDAVTPGQLRSFAENNLEPGEELQLLFNSPGGSVFAGLALANIVRKLSADGHKVTGIVQGVCASAASLILCACDEIILPYSGLVMIHLPWTTMSGNSDDLRKEADTLDTVLRAMVGIYKTKFALPENEIIRLLEEETWFSGREAGEFKFDCTVIDDADDFSIAAKVRGFDMGKFRNFKNMIDEEKTQADAEVVTEETNPEETAPVVENQAEETTVEDSAVEVPSGETIPEETTPEETTPEETTPEEMIPRAEVDKRISGLQSALAKDANKRLDALRGEYQAKLDDLNTKLKSKDEELINAAATINSLTGKLESVTKENEELIAKSSALSNELQTKTDALAKLNAAVLTPNMDTPKNWRNLKGKEFFDFLRDHPELAK